MTGIYEASKKHGFTDCSSELFYVDYIEPGQPKKAPFVLRSELMIIYPCFFFKRIKIYPFESDHRIVQFEKGSVNILMEKDEKSKFRAIILLDRFIIIYYVWNESGNFEKILNGNGIFIK